MLVSVGIAKMGLSPLLRTRVHTSRPCQRAAGGLQRGTPPGYPRRRARGAAEARQSRGNACRVAASPPICTSSLPSDPGRNHTPLTGLRSHRSGAACNSS